MKKEILKSLSPLVSVLINLLLAYIVYFIARIVYFFENYDYFINSLNSFAHTMEILYGGLVFDTSAIFLTNSFWIILVLFPFFYKENPCYHNVCKWIFITINTLALIINLCDSVYFRYSMRRTTTTIFQEFSNENNIIEIIFSEVISHWYLFLLIIVVVWILNIFYFKPKLNLNDLEWKTHTFILLLSLVVFTPFCIAGIRGGFTTAVRPITISNANQYAVRPIEAALILNTPFSIYRTIGKNVFEIPNYFVTNAELNSVYTPIHVPTDTLLMVRKNVVVLIVESFGREYIGAFNKHLEDGNYKGFTPFADSLIAKSITFSHSYSNGRKSIDGMPSILSAIPMFVEPFFLTPASMNEVSGIAKILRTEGYHTAFFHGADNGSMGFQAFARSTGFSEYYGRNEYNDDKRFGGETDFDGTWAIWDEPFLQYYATKMSEMPQPFMTSVFTASSHHPYVIPDKYKNIYPEEMNKMHRCVRYTDMALKKFFQTASKQPWYKNTIFVLTADHTNLSSYAEYQTDLGGFSVPIIIYEPGGSIVPCMQDKIAQQIDIMPTLLGILAYPKPYIAFGKDLLKVSKEDSWAVNYLNGIYQYVKYNYVLQFDGKSTIAIYSLDDRLMKNNLIGTLSEQKLMENELKAIIQQYMECMVMDKLVYK